MVPWYGVDIPGGAEAETRRTAEHLHRAGVPVEILTTCVKEFQADWAQDYHRPGVTRENDVLVRRFPVAARDRVAFDAVNLKLMRSQPITSEEEEIFVRHNVNSFALTEYIREHLVEYIFVFIPYLFGTTYAGVAACEGKALLIPCLHDESYARLTVTRRMVSQVRKLILHSPAELALAADLYPLPEDRPILLGEGVDTDFVTDAADFRRRYGVAGPFILYAGRKDEGKNVDVLIEYFRRYRRGRKAPLDLILLGGGQLPVPVAANEGIRDLGFVPVQDKYNAYAAATLLCQPSQRESFSLVLMEAWVAGTPALVHSDCAVTRDHCVRGRGGLCFASYPEFEACLDLLLDYSPLRKRLGANGREYVLDNYRWDVIVDRYRALFAEVVKTCDACLNDSGRAGDDAATPARELAVNALGAGLTG